MKKLLSLILCLVFITSVLVACTPDGCAHQYVDGVCKLCTEKDSKYQASTGGSQSTPCAHVYVDGVCKNCQANDANYVPPTGALETGELAIAGNGKYLLADSNGNYGGTLNRGKYGEGAALNGKYDVENSDYYTINDFYHMQSTKMADGKEERTIYTGFAPYQQTMADSSGIAGMIAVLNYWGETVTTDSEVELVNKYEEINGTTVYGNGTTGEGLVGLWTALGYTASYTKYNETTTTRADQIEEFRVWLQPLLNAGKMVFVRHQDNTDNRWKLIIGYDNMGTLDWIYDDIVIFADPYDTYDHYQDGYSISAAGRFKQWFLAADAAGKVTNKHMAVIVEPKQEPTINRILGSEDPTQIAQAVIPENNIYRNWGQTETLPEGSYGGTMDKSKYGSGAQQNGIRDSLDRNYHKFSDFHNMGNTDSRLLLTGYRGFTQTHKSSCGPCALFSILMYYGYDREVYNEEVLVKKYESFTGAKVYNKGTSATSIAGMLVDMGFEAEGSVLEANYDVGSLNFPTYESFIAFIKQNLSIGQPVAVSWRPCGGHWEVIVGYDDMGTDYVYDDVVVMADSGDTWDHYQDGFNVHAATQFYRQWFNLSITMKQGYFVVKRAAN